MYGYSEHSLYRSKLSLYLDHSNSTWKQNNIANTITSDTKLYFTVDTSG